MSTLPDKPHNLIRSTAMTQDDIDANFQKCPPQDPQPVQLQINKELKQTVHGIDQLVQSNNLNVNFLKEKHQHTQIQHRTFQQVQDKLQINLHALTIKIEELEEKYNSIISVPQTPWFYGQCTKEKQMLYTARDFKSETSEWVTKNEQVLLLHPLKLDETGNVWARIQRVFENGTIECYFVPFYLKETQEKMFDNFTFSSASHI
jgi:hypothetical protein